MSYKDELPDLITIPSNKIRTPETYRNAVPHLGEDDQLQTIIIRQDAREDNRGFDCPWWSFYLLSYTMKPKSEYTEKELADKLENERTVEIDGHFYKVERALTDAEIKEHHGFDLKAHLAKTEEKPEEAKKPAKKAA